VQPSEGRDGRLDIFFKNPYSSSDGLWPRQIERPSVWQRGGPWDATEGGLSRIKDGQIRTLTSRNGLPCDPVIWSRQDDDDSSSWLYMPCGLVRITRSELDGGVADPTRTVKTTVFGISDGVRGHGVPSGYWHLRLLRNRELPLQSEIQQGLAGNLHLVSLGDDFRTCSQCCSGGGADACSFAAAGCGANDGSYCP